MTENRHGDRVAGIALIAAAALSMLAMAHHPAHVGDGALIQIVHGALILFTGMMMFGFAQLSRRLGLERPAVLGGLVAYAIGAIAEIGAATINGFAMPALAGHGASHDAIDTLWFLNQALAGLGVAAIGVAYTLWSLALWRRHKAVAAVGVVAGAVPALLLLGGWIDMHLHWAILVYAALVLWAALAGWLLLSGRLGAQADAD